MSYYGWRPYVPVAKRQAQALRKMKKLKKQGLNVQPIVIEKRKIAKTFWGKAWCEHIESFSDYENRLPRGRSYVRNGSVCHLEIVKGKVSAMVAGSSLYKIEINITALPVRKWQSIKKQCSGQIGSLLELLGGELSDSVMNAVCHQQKGLFPAPKEIQLSCNCPDWAIMCKHVAAVLYGVGARLDQDPSQLFLLRGVDHEELIDVPAVITDATQKGKAGRKHIDDSALTDIFGIEIESKNKNTSVDKKKQLRAKKQKKLMQPTKPAFPTCLTGTAIRKKRKSLELTQAALAKILVVSSSRISQWECNGRKRFNLKKTTKRKLQKIW